MENTNCKDNCPFVKCGICETDEGCPNFVRSWWIVGNNPNPKEIKDCFPKKSTAQINSLEQRILASQSVSEEVRNRLDKLETLLIQLIMQTKDFMKSEDISNLLKSDLKLQLPEINNEHSN